MQYGRIDNELQFDWIEGRWVSCFRLLYLREWRR